MIISLLCDNVNRVGHNETYFCRKDILGNIIALLDTNGSVVVKYTYDAWGNNVVSDANGTIITDANHIGNLNPFRYRSYYYDTEIKLYYLKTRYYDPEIGRFMTIDGIEYLDPETINGLNLYAYCGNNPVSNVDPNGNAWWHWVVGIVLVAATTIAMVTTAGLAATVIGVSSSVATAMMVGAGVATATAGVVNLGIQASQGVEEFNIGSLIGDMVFNGTVGIIAGGVGAAIGVYSIGVKTATQLLIHRGMQAGANILISSTAYIVSNAIRGEQISLYGFAASIITGFVSGAFFDLPTIQSMLLAGGLEIISYGNVVIEIVKRFLYKQK